MVNVKVKIQDTEKFVYLYVSTLVMLNFANPDALYTPSSPVDQQRRHASRCLIKLIYDILRSHLNNRQLHDTLMLADYLIKKEFIIQLREQ